MRIKQLQLNNFRGFEGEVTIDFDPQLTVLVGVNGSGKSSVMDAFSYCLEYYLDQFYEYSYGPLFKLEDINLNSAVSNLMLSIQSDSKGNDIIEIDFDGYMVHLKNENSWKEKGKSVRSELRKKKGLNIDIVSVLKRTRIEIETDEDRPYKPMFFVPQVEAFDGSLDSRYSGARMLNWFIDQTNLENQQKIENRDFDAVNPKLQVVRNALTHFLTSFPYANFSNLRTGESPFSAHRTKKQTFLIDKNGKTLELNQLSDGEKGALLIVFDIAYRLAIANPSLENPLEGSGVVLIDEIDLHLHPSWQKAILHCLRSTFPNLQFVVTTHSPLVISQVKPEQLRILNEGKVLTVKDFVGPFNSYGAEMEDILSLIQGVNETMSDELAQKFKRFFDLIESDNIEEATALKRELEKITDPNHPDILKGQSLMDLKKLGIG